VIRIAPARGRIVIDGVLDDTGWQGAAAVTLRWETYPGENTPAPVSTLCRVTYDSDRLYVGCEARDPDPAAIRAQLRERDRLWPDDRINLTLDPGFTGRIAYFFSVNAVGAQGDGVLTRNGTSFDVGWDGIWSAAARIGRFGYSVEIAIPFRTITLPAGEHDVRWGLVISRIYPRDVRREFSSRPYDRGDSCTLCQANVLTGFPEARSGSRMALVPSVTVLRTVVRAEPPDGAWKTETAAAEPGLTIEWSPRANGRLLAALNPDFSQVEVDVPQIEINRRFAIFFPEKRPFFLADSGYLDTPRDVINTRAVADPDWGAKVSGTWGRWSGYAFVAHDALTNLVVPGPERSSSTPLPGESLDWGFRIRREIGEHSMLGGVLTGRVGEDGYSSHLVGVDGLLRLGRADDLSWQLLGSTARYPDDLVAQLGERQGWFNGWGLVAEYRHRGRDWVWSAGTDYRSMGLRADLGYLPQVGIWRGEASVERRWWGDSNGWYTGAGVGLTSSYTRTTSGSLLARSVAVESSLETWGQSSIRVKLTRRTEAFGGALFSQRVGSVGISAEPWRTVAAELWVSRGDAIDFAHAAPAREFSSQARVKMRFGRRLTSEVRYWRQHLWRERGTLFLTQLGDLRTQYSLNPRSSLRLVVQYRDTRLGPAYWSGPLRSKRLFWRVLFSYRVNAITEFFAGFSVTGVGGEEFGVAPARRSVFVKMRYAYLG